MNNPGKILSDVLHAAAEHVVIERWLRYGFWKKSELCGRWFIGKYFRLPARLVSAEETEEEVTHSLGAIYAFDGTFDEFLVRFCKVPMDTTIKRCPNKECGEYFTSSPEEFLRHIVECAGKADRAKTKKILAIDGDHDDCCRSCC